jgi:hypothetical protein
VRGTFDFADFERRGTSRLRSRSSTNRSKRKEGNLRSGCKCRREQEEVRKRIERERKKSYKSTFIPHAGDASTTDLTANAPVPASTTLPSAIRAEGPTTVSKSP